MREEILKQAEIKLVIHGFERFNFGLVAKDLSCTRATIYYYFSSKEKLVEKVILNYVRKTEVEFQKIWQDMEKNLSEKITETKNYNHRRYVRFNPSEMTGKSWSLIARMRGSQEMLSTKSRRCLQDFGPNIEAWVREAIAVSKGKGELLRDAPVDDITLLVVSIINSAGPITQDSGNFCRLDSLYLASARIIDHAYGSGRPVRTEEHSSEF